MTEKLSRLNALSRSLAEAERIITSLENFCKED